MIICIERNGGQGMKCLVSMRGAGGQCGQGTVYDRIEMRTIWLIGSDMAMKNIGKDSATYQSIFYSGILLEPTAKLGHRLL